MLPERMIDIDLLISGNQKMWKKLKKMLLAGLS
jgi:hypothetical protein